MLSYVISAADRLLLANAISLSIPLSGASSVGLFVSTYNYSRVAPSPTPDVSVSKYSGFVSL